MNINNKPCAGCGACVSICPASCIDMLVGKDGFYRASANAEQCVDCGKCLQECTLHKTLQMRTPKAAYAAFSKDPSVRKTSSSGGVFAHLAQLIVKQGGSVFGAAFDRNMELKHISVDSEKELLPLQGSKYLQSKAWPVFEMVKQKLEEGIPILFVGTPCQVAAIYTVLGKEYDNFLTADLICHGAPAPNLFRGYLKFLEKQYHGTITDYHFRSKENANDRMSYTVKLNIDRNGKTDYIFLSGDEEPYAMRFISGALQGESCFNCPFASHDRMGDLTLGDYWGYEKAHPEIADEMGVSLVLVNSDKGRMALENIDGLTLVKTESNKYLTANGHLSSPPQKHPDHDAIYLAFSEDGFSSKFYHRVFLPKGYKIYLLKRRIRSMLR